MAKFTKDNLTKTVKIYGDPIKIIGAENEKGLIELLVNVTAQAKELAPNDKGQLENSIMWKTSTGKGGFNDGSGEKSSKPITGTAKQGEGYVGTNVEYSTYQEFGTRKQVPQPYLRPAIAIEAQGQNINKVLKDIDRAVQNSLKNGKNPIFEKEFSI